LQLKVTRWELDHGVATLTLSRPKSYNAWTGRMHTELRHLLQRAESDRTIRVVVITGDRGGGTFCPGADTAALQGHADRGAYDAGTPNDIATPGFGVRDEFDTDFAYFFGMETITIAAVNGAAAGVGFALACWCDLRIVADDAKLTTAHGKLNLPAEYGLSWILPRLIGHGRAADLLLSSRIVLGPEAVDLGLATRSLPTERVLDAAQHHAHRLVADISPHSLRATKRQLAVDATHDNPAASIRDAQHRLEQMMSERDYREGTAAFIGRRPPDWHDS
jgi:enoyl-CoA hydratase/carnithine racemase